jgi:NADH-quinone oxidoreductase subunit N
VATISLIHNDGSYFSGMLLVDNFGIFLRCLFLLASILTVLSSEHYLENQRLHIGEYYALILFATIGMNLMAGSSELIMLFLGLETLSISSYILLGVRRADPKSNESAMKYFLLGSFSSAFLLYGIAMFYGATKSTNLRQIATQIASHNCDMLFVSLATALILVGLGFKVGMAPFHFWVPDVYEGAPSPITGFMSAGPKAAGIAVLLRILSETLPATYSKWWVIVWIAALLTMTLGNLGALAQSNIKRMLAYSSIAHTGYILVALATGSNEATASILFYLLAYALTNLGAFLVVAVLAKEGEKRVTLEDYAGLATRHPLLAASLSIFLLSLAGIPLTAGFAGKFFIFRTAIQSGMIGLAIVGLLNSVVSVYYYSKILVYMYMKETPQVVEELPINWSVRLALGISLFSIFLLGITPNFVLNLARLSSFNLH